MSKPMDSYAQIRADMASQVFWTLIIQAAWLFALGACIFIFPPALFIMVALTAFWGGLTLLVLAVRVRRYRTKAARALN